MPLNLVPKITSNKRLLILGTALLGSLGLGLYWLSSVLAANHATLFPALTWRSLTLGKTTFAEVLNMLGPPTAQAVRSDYVVYVYEERVDLSWEYVEVWGEVRGQQTVVVGVLRDWPYYQREAMQLAEFIAAYGRPDQVTWGKKCSSRYLFWAKYGLAISASADAKWTQPIVEILFFEPTVRSVLTRFWEQWPWNNRVTVGPSRSLSCANSDVRDIAPEDPFDWQNLPLAQTPIPTLSPN